MKKVLRVLTDEIRRDLNKKIVILAGPRQCGKTTLSKELFSKFEYLSYDSFDDRADILNQRWERKTDLLILDELHKMPKWKSWVKGIYDKEGVRPRILVTGSARLNTFKKTGDSLAGRHFYYRLHPFDLKELTKAHFKMSHQEAFSRFMSVGGYPEPFLNGDPNEYRRWRQGHLDIILKQDLRDLEVIRDVKGIEILIQLLRSKVGSGVSANSLAVDLQKDHKTVQRWLETLEDLFVIFRVTPYSKDLARSIKKEPKFYFYDNGLVVGDDSQKLENLVACSLLKEANFLTDAKGQNYALHYLRVKGGREIDFALVPEDPSEIASMIEVKWGDADASSNFKLFEGSFKHVRKVQLVQSLKRDHTTANGVEVRQASTWLCDFKIDV